MKNLKIGVEIEFFGCTKEEVARALRAKGVAANVEGYNHNTPTCWKITTDASVTTSGTDAMNGNEIVSPILYGDAGLDELEVVMETLVECGAKVDKTCGVHIHHDVNDYSVENFKSLYNFMYEYKNVIDAMMPKSRRQSATEGYCRAISSSEIAEINEATTVYSMDNAIGTRYKTLNIKSFVKYGTIEFRQHSGTVESEKVVNWAILTHLIVNYAKENKVNIHTGSRGTLQKSMETMFAKLNINGSNVGDYVTKRIQTLSSEQLTGVA